jgi:hypothetical protein
VRARPAIAVVLVTLSLCAYAQGDASERVCHKLPEGSGFLWRYNQGPDFDVCIAQRSWSQGQLIGTYLGHNPNF